MENVGPIPRPRALTLSLSQSEVRELAGMDAKPGPGQLHPLTFYAIVGLCRSYVAVWDRPEQPRRGSWIRRLIARL